MAPDGRIGELARLVKATAGRTIPAPSLQDQAAFAALQALARAYAMAKPDRRRRLLACLSGLAGECERAAGWSFERTSAKPPKERSSWEPRDLFEFARGPVSEG